MRRVFSSVSLYDIVVYCQVQLPEIYEYRTDILMTKPVAQLHKL